MTGGVNAAARLDRLPMSRFHWRTLSLIGAGMFVDNFDNVMAGGILAVLVSQKFSTLALNAQFISSTFVGIAAGAACAGVLGDRFGRRFAYQFNLLIFGLMCLLSSAAPSMPWLIGLRGIMGIGIGAEYVVGYSMIAEFLPPTRRGRMAGLIAAISSFGGFCASAISIYVVPEFGWRAMFAIGGLAALFVWFLRRKLPESPRWLESAGRNVEAEAVVRQIEQEVSGGAELPPVPIMPAKPVMRVPLSILFTKPVIGRTLLAVALNVVALVGSYTFNSWVPTYFIRQGLSVTRTLSFTSVIMFGSVVGPLLTVSLSDRIGRQRSLVAAAASCCVVGAIYSQLQSPNVIVVFGFLLSTSMTFMLSLVLLTTPELFPTAYRFRGAGFGQMCGRAAVIGSPFVVISMFDGFGLNGVIGLLAVLYCLLGIGILFMGIETGGKPLEAVEADLHPIEVEPISIQAH